MSGEGRREPLREGDRERVGDVVTAIEALTRYHAAEKRLAEVEKLIEEWASYNEWERLPWRDRRPETRPMPEEPLSALILERERLQAESFRVYMAARSAS